MAAFSRVEEAVRADARGALKATGRQAGLGELYDAHAAAAYRLLLAMLGSPAEAQDALSEVFLAVARRDLRRLRSPRAYLLAAARHQAILMMRRRRREIPTDPADPRFFDPAALDPDQALLARQVESALRELPPEQREVIVLKVYEELTFAEIARLTRTRPNTVASRYRYAVEKLRSRLKEEGT